MTEEMREQMLNVMFNNSESDKLSESQELDEGLGTVIKHAAQNVKNNIANSFAITAKQKAQAANRTATLKATQAAEKAGNKAVAQAKKAGNATYKTVMSNWTIKNANEAMQNAVQAQDMDTFIKGLEFALCGINVLDAGKVNGQQSEEAQQNVNKANANNQQAGKNAVNNAKNDKQQNMANAGNVSNNPADAAANVNNAGAAGDKGDAQ